MTENQEKEMFGLLNTAVTEAKEIRKILNEHSVILNEHSAILNEHSTILNEHSTILKDHGEKLDLLINRTDDIANTVMVNDTRLTAVEKGVADLRGGVH